MRSRAPVLSVAVTLVALAAVTSFVVAGASRPATDTLGVRLRLATASRLTGTTTLAGRTDQSGIIVSTEAMLDAIATSDALGNWTLDDVPPGTWHLTMFCPGFATAARTVVVPAPGSAIVAPAVQLN